MAEAITPEGQKSDAYWRSEIDKAQARLDEMLALDFMPRVRVWKAKVESAKNNAQRHAEGRQRLQERISAAVPTLSATDAQRLAETLYDGHHYRPIA